MTAPEAELLAAAREASQRAYCPYSKFRVGAAVRGNSGRIFAGCNFENASYGLTICAERSAVAQLIAAGDRSFSSIAVYTPTPAPTAPCGACRQVLNEFAPHAEVVCACDGPAIIRSTVCELLPGAFGLENLSENDNTAH